MISPKGELHSAASVRACDVQFRWGAKIHRLVVMVKYLSQPINIVGKRLIVVEVRHRKVDCDTVA